MLWHSEEREPASAPCLCPHHLRPLSLRKQEISVGPFPSAVLHQVVCMGGVHSGFSLTEGLQSRWDTIFIFSPLEARLT